MQYLTAIDCLSNLQDIYSRFLKSKKDHLFMVIGAAHSGKRWNLEQAVNGRDDVTWHRGAGIDEDFLYATLFAQQEKVIIFHEKLCEIIPNNKAKKMLLAIKDNKPIKNPSKGNTTSLPGEFVFTGKIILIDSDPVEKSGVAVDEFPGYIFARYTLLDLLLYCMLHFNSLCTSMQFNRDDFLAVLNYFRKRISDGSLQADAQVHGLSLIRDLLDYYHESIPDLHDAYESYIRNSMITVNPAHQPPVSLYSELPKSK